MRSNRRLRMSNAQNGAAAAAAAPEPKKKRGWIAVLIYLIYIAILAFATYKLWVYVWNSLAGFEENSFNTQYRLMLDDYKMRWDGEITAKKVSSKDGNLSYDIYVDGENYCNANLILLPKQGFLGMPLYKRGSEKGNRSVEFEAIEGSPILAGSKLISELTPAETGLPIEDLSRLASYEKRPFDVPTFSRFRLENLFELPDIKGDGVELVTVSEGPPARYALEVSEELKTELSEKLVKLTRAYSLFVTNDGSFYDCAPYLRKNTPIYKQLGGLYVGDYTPHDYVTFGDEFIFSDFIKYTDSLVSCRVKYEYSVIGQKKQYDYSPTITYYLSNDSGKWLVCEMLISE